VPAKLDPVQPHRHASMRRPHRGQGHRHRLSDRRTGQSNAECCPIACSLTCSCGVWRRCFDAYVASHEARFGRLTQGRTSTFLLQAASVEKWQIALKLCPGSQSDHPRPGVFYKLPSPAPTTYTCPFFSITLKLNETKLLLSAVFSNQPHKTLSPIYPPRLKPLQPSAS
jgi:hypothetical protein